jgi:hypothetical protein
LPVFVGVGNLGADTGVEVVGGVGGGFGDEWITGDSVVGVGTEVTGKPGMDFLPWSTG